MKEFKLYTKQEKIIAVLSYSLAFLLPILIIIGVILVNNSKMGKENNMKYKINDPKITINNVEEGVTLDLPVSITNNNAAVKYFVRFTFEVDKKLVESQSVSDLLMATNSKNKLVNVDDYYYVPYARTADLILFDRLEWLQDKKTADDMKFNIIVETIPARQAAVQEVWIKSGNLTKAQAKTLGYIK